MTIYNLKIEPGDDVLPCPFCGSENVELNNSWTASYWVECLECEGRAHGKAFGTDCTPKELTLRHNKLAKASALAAWNRRDSSPERERLFEELLVWADDVGLDPERDASMGNLFERLRKESP